MVSLIDPTEKANKSSEDCCSQRGKIQQANQKTHENIFLHPGTELHNARVRVETTLSSQGNLP